ncbi:hypothetical protein ACJRO7_016065, partial [Eucalyptus globulus]
RNVYHSSDPIYFPAKLRWLEWPEYSQPSMPFNTGDKKLLFRNLRSVNFSHCILLTKILDVLSLPNLESLDLKECTKLVEVHQPLGHLSKLVYLNFLNCSNLSCFPSSLKARSLENLIFRGCSKLSRFLGILVQVKCLKTLALHETAIEELPSSLANFVKLKELCLRDCANLKNLSRSIYALQHLERISVDGCSQLTKFPECVWGSSDCTNVSLPLALSSIINLNICQRKKFASLPTCIIRFAKLQQLCLMHCKQLREILALPPNITSLHARGCEYLETCGDMLDVLRYNPDESPWLRQIDFSSCWKLIQDRCSNNCTMLSIEFIHQSTTGLIRFLVLSKSYRDIAGLAFCANVNSSNWKEVNVSREVQLFVNNQETYSCVDCFSLLESDHVWLLYVPRRM